MKLADHVAGWLLSIALLGVAQVLANVTRWPWTWATAIAVAFSLLAIVAAQTFMTDRQAAATWAMMLGVVPVMAQRMLVEGQPELRDVAWGLVGGFFGGRILGAAAAVVKRASFVLVAAHAVWVLALAIAIVAIVGRTPAPWSALALFGVLGSAAFLARGRRKWRAYARLAETGRDAKHLGKLRVELEGGEIVTVVRSAGLAIGPVVIDPSAKTIDGAYREGRSIEGRVVEGTRAELQTTGEDLAFRYTCAALAWSMLACAPALVSVLR